FFLKFLISMLFFARCFIIIDDCVIFYSLATVNSFVYPVYNRINWNVVGIIIIDYYGFHMRQRYYSLDVFRGATVALMILVNNPGTWSHMFSPLKHAPWHGCTPTDLVFPFFLFAVGNAMAFVMPRLQEAGDTTFWKKVVKRTVLIFAIGLFVNWWPFIQWSGDSLQFREWVSSDNPERGVRL